MYLSDWPLYPSEWPEWIRESAAGWFVVAVLIWFSLQRYFDKPAEGLPRTLLPYGRPTRDPRIICALLGFAVASAEHIGGIHGHVVHLQTGTQTMLVVVTVIGVLLSLGGAFIRDEWFSVGLELPGCICLAGAFTIYSIGYVDTVRHWSILCAFFALGNALRVFQLLRRVR